MRAKCSSRPERLPLSAVIIAAAEGERLLPTLHSLHFVDEVVVVVSDATSPTHAVATRFGAKVVVQSWLGFGQQKNFALNLAKNDWVLSVDADEVVNEQLAQSIQAVFSAPDFNSDKAPCAYRLRRINHFLGKALFHGEGGNDWLVRLFNRQAAKWSFDAVHEKIIFHAQNPNVATLEGWLHHFSAENLSDYVQKQIRYSELAQAIPTRSRKALSGYHLWVNPCWRFFRFYVIKRGFLDGWAGFAHISLGAFATFLKYLYRYEKTRAKSKPPGRD